MEKLEPKELIPYLPYSLKVIMEGKKCNVAWMSTKNIAVIRPDGIGEYKTINWENAHLNIKPILRPLSSEIIKQTFIEVDGSKDSIHVSAISTKGRQTIDWYNDNGWDLITGKGYMTIQENKEYCFTEKMRNHLLSQHVDLFGLIKKGLAIDYNKVNKN